MNRYKIDTTKAKKAHVLSIIWYFVYYQIHLSASTNCSQTLFNVIFVYWDIMLLECSIQSFKLLMPWKCHPVHRVHHVCLIDSSLQLDKRLRLKKKKNRCKLYGIYTVWCYIATCKIITIIIIKLIHTNVYSKGVIYDVLQ